MKLSTALITAAVAATSVIAQPAQANLVSNANDFCRAGYKLNKAIGQSVAPGTVTGLHLSKKTYNGYSYATLWNVAKDIGTDSDCRRLY